MRAATFTPNPTWDKCTVRVARRDTRGVLLVRDKTEPWLIWVPAIAGFPELDEPDASVRSQEMTEIYSASKAMKAVFQPYKMNVAALGNVVEQLHIHVIARFQTDPAWPAPVWGAHPAQDYDDAHRRETLTQIRDALGVH